MKPSFPRRGEHDDKPTPRELRISYTDVCTGEFDALSAEWPDGAYCNPPWSRKAPFVYKAIEEAKKGKRVALLLPLDPTTKWFKALLEANATIIILTRRMAHARYPWFIALLPGDGRTLYVDPEEVEL